MVAAAFKAVLKFVGTGGQVMQYFCTVSDVNAAFYIFPDGNNFTNLPPLPPGQVWGLVDVLLSAAGTDTTTATIFVNQKNTGETVVNAANVATNLSRQFMGTPIYIAPGSNLRFTQNT